MRVTLDEQSLAIWQSQNLEHLRYEYDLKPDDVVIDLGAYRGEWSEEIFRRYKCKMVLVEPGPWIVGCHAGLVINKAASTYNGKQKFGGAYYYTSSHEEGGTEYECFDINALLRQETEIALVKMNVEGSEFDLLEHIYKAGLMPRIRDLQVQFHLIEGEQAIMRYGALSGLLSETHSLTWQFSFCWENWRRDDDRMW